MRNILLGASLGLLVTATFGCGGSASESGSVADGGGQPAAAAPGSGEAAPGAAAGMAETAGDPGASAEAAAGGDPNALTIPSPGADGAGAAPGYPGAGYPGAQGESDGGTNTTITPGAGYPGGTGTGGTAEYPGGGLNPGANREGAGGEAGTLSTGGTNPGGVGYPGGTGPNADGTLGGGEAAPPATFDAFAKQAFSQGKDREAIQYLQAWALTSDAGASEVLSGIQWVNGLKRPAMAVRWGIGIQIAAPRGFSGDAKPIGTQQEFRTGRKGGDRDANAGGPGFAGGAESGFAGGSGGGGGNEAIEQYTGEFGGKILEKFQTYVSSGKFGKALKDAPTGTSGSEGGVGYGGGGGFAGAGSDLQPGAAGGAGGRMPGRGGRGGGMPDGLGGSGAGAVAAGQIATGLTMLGAGTEKELKDKALEARVDVLAIFRVKLAVTRAGYIDNNSEIVVLHPLKGTVFHESGTLNNIKVQKDRELDKDDGVEKEVKELFEVIDKELTVTDLPSKATPALVKTNRVEKQLLVGTIDDPLSVLTEIRFYHRNKLLTDADAAAAIAKVAGGEANAKTLLEGKEEDRKKLVEKWLPKG